MGNRAGFRRPPVVERAAFDFQVCRVERVPAMGRQHRHHEVEINYLEAGRVTYLINGVAAVVPARRWCVFWGAVPHRIIRADEDAARGLWWTTIPLAWVLSWNLPAGFVGRLLDGQLCRDTAAFDSDLPKLTDWLASPADGSAAARATLLEIEARLLRFAATQTGRRAGRAAASTGELGKVERIATYIVAHYTNPIRLSDIAAAVGLHPNYAATLFRSQCGETIGGCLTQHRVAHAQRLLATTELKMLDVALDSGFASVSRFYDAFGKACGVAPAAYRRPFRN